MKLNKKITKLYSYQISGDGYEIYSDFVSLVFFRVMSGNKKRGYNSQESMAYLGIKRKAFDKHFRPFLRPLSFGTSLLFDRLDLDRIWEQYKRGNERLIQKGEIIWADKVVSTKTTKIDGVSIKSIVANDFESALKLLKKQKTS